MTYIRGFSTAIIEWIIDHLQGVGRITAFFVDALLWLFRYPYRFRDIIIHMEYIGNRSVFIILLTGAFTGMALSYQVYIGFSLVNMTNLVGPIVALGIARELGPVLTGLVVAARAGGAMAARIGTMRVTEQIDALEVMSVNPVQYLVSPRLVAAVCCLPMLTAVFDFIAMAGAYMLCVNVLGLDSAIFWDKVDLWLQPRHINEGLFKAACFGLIFSVVCTYRGYYTEGGARGVGESTNQGVVSSMVLIIITDYFLTNVIRIYYRFIG